MNYETAVVVLDHSYSVLYRPTPRVTAVASTALTAKRQVYLGGGLSDVEYVPLYDISWDGSRVFLTGLVERVVSVLNQHGIYVQFHDQRDWTLTPAGQDFAGDFEGALYPDQHHTVAQMIKHGRGVVKAATNAGKTFITAAYWHAMGRPTMLMLTQQKSLIDQNAKDIENVCGLAEGTVGRVGGGFAKWKPVTVATNKSASNMAHTRGEFPFRFSILIADEGDTLVKKTARTIVRALPHTPFRFWLSGTPYKNREVEDMLITGYAGAQLADISNRSLIQQDRSAQPIVLFAKNYLATNDQELKEYDGNQRYEEHLIPNAERNAIIQAVAQAAVDKNQTVLTFVEFIEHAKQIEALCPEAHVVTGRDGARHQNEIIQILNFEKGHHVIATSTWQRGLSIPNIDVLINAAGRKSTTQVLQRFGRLLRKKDTGNVGWLVDFQDKHGINLEKHARQRAWTFYHEGIPVYSVEPDVLLNGVLPGRDASLSESSKRYRY